MGSAMLEGWLEQDAITAIHVLDPHPPSINDSKISHTTTYLDYIKYIQGCNALVLAVKPQIMTDICEQLKNDCASDLPIISIAAGYSLSSFHQFFNESQPIIRAMPNTPGAIGKGITGLYNAPNLSDNHRALADTLLSALGETLWVDDENLMDAITAVSGSGPAYVFYLMEALEKAATDAGLPADIARKLARQTVIGSAALAKTDNATQAATLRENVTSPGGTTEAALKILMDGRFEKALSEAVQAAKSRGHELSQG